MHLLVRFEMQTASVIILLLAQLPLLLVTYSVQGKYLVPALKPEGSPPALCVRIGILAVLGDALSSWFTHELGHC